MSAQRNAAFSMMKLGSNHNIEDLPIHSLMIIRPPTLGVSSKGKIQIVRNVCLIVSQDISRNSPGDYHTASTASFSAFSPWETQEDRNMLLWAIEFLEVKITTESERCSAYQFKTASNLFP